MIYRLISRTFSEDGSAELVFVQKIKDFDPAMPVKAVVRALVFPEYFRERGARTDEFDFRFENREIRSIDGRPVEEILGDAKEVRITFSYAYSTEGEPVLLPTDDEVLESEIIE